MKKSAIEQYSEVMEEIKRRFEVIDFFLIKRGHALYEPTTIETICLQFRKILELIAMASLVANKKEYEKIYKNFAKSWNAEYLINDLERVNPKFYPQPITESPSNIPGIKSNQEDIKEGILDKKDFIRVYKKCGGMLHADNPLGRKSNYKYYDNAQGKTMMGIDL